MSFIINELSVSDIISRYEKDITFNSIIITILYGDDNLQKRMIKLYPSFHFKLSLIEMWICAYQVNENCEKNQGIRVMNFIKNYLNCTLLDYNSNYDILDAFVKSRRLSEIHGFMKFVGNKQNPKIPAEFLYIDTKFIDIGNDSIVNEFQRLTQKYYKKLSASEFINYHHSPASNRFPNILKLNVLSEKITYLVPSIIMNPPLLEDKIKLYKKFLRIAEKHLQKNNMHIFISIILGLDNPNIEKLNIYASKKMAKYKNLISVNNNYSAYRSHIDIIRQNKQPYFPYLAVLHKDYENIKVKNIILDDAFIDYDFIKNNLMIDAENILQKNICFDKLDIIDKILLHIDNAQGNNFEIEKEVYFNKYFKKYLAYDDNQLYMNANTISRSPRITQNVSKFKRPGFRLSKTFTPDLKEVPLEKPIVPKLNIKKLSRSVSHIVNPTFVMPSPLTRSVLTPDVASIKDVDSWSTADVIDWLYSIHLPEYATHFKNNHITGKCLHMLTKEMLLDDLKIVPLGHRLEILMEIKKL